jgi:hypothetical protein
MKIKINIDCENAAFEESEGLEVARLLRHLADGFEGAEDGVVGIVPLFDINGNKVGRAVISES